MRILHVVSTLAAGGIASSLYHILPHLSGLPNLQVEMATLHARGHFGDLLAQNAIPIHELHLHRKYAPQALPRLRALLRRTDYDIVHVHGWPALAFVALASLQHRGPHYVYTEHNVTNRRRQWPALRPLERWIYSRYARLIAVSDRVAEALITWLPDTTAKVRVIHNGVQPGQFHQPPGVRARARASLNVAPNTPLLLLVGSLHHQKGVDLLIDALAGLAPETWKHEPTLLICGDGHLQPSLRAQATQHGLDDRIHFLGHRHDVPHLMAAADLLVLPSRWEGCPMAILEAMASGLPVLATSVGGVPELIEDGVHGRLVPPQDPVALAEAIDWMVSHPDLTAGMASRARQRVATEFAAEGAALKLAKAYGELSGLPGD